MAISSSRTIPIGMVVDLEEPCEEGQTNTDPGLPCVWVPQAEWLSPEGSKFL